MGIDVEVVRCQDALAILDRRVLGADGDEILDTDVFRILLNE